MVLLLLSAQFATSVRFAAAQPLPSPEDTVFICEVVWVYGGMLNKPLIAVEKPIYERLVEIVRDELKVGLSEKVLEAIKEGFDKYIVLSESAHVVTIFGSEIIDWYGGEEEVWKLVKELKLFGTDTAKNEWLANEVVEKLKEASWRKFDAVVEKYHAGKVYQIFFEYKSKNDFAVDDNIVNAVKEALVDKYLSATGKIKGVIHWHITSAMTDAPDERAKTVINEILSGRIAVTRVTGGRLIAEALDPHFKRVYGEGLFRDVIPAVKGVIRDLYTYIVVWIKKHPVETALFAAIGIDMAIALLDQYIPPRSLEEAEARSAVRDAARSVSNFLSLTLNIEDFVKFALALELGAKSVALETGVGILIWAATNLLYLTLTGQWGKEFLIGKTCESVCGRGVCLAMYGVYAVPRMYYLVAIVDGETIAETRAENPNEASFWAVLEPFNVVKGDVAVKCAGAFCQVNVTSREVNETPTDNGCALVEEKLWMCSWKATVAGVVYSQKIFPVEKWLLGSPNYTEKCPWTPPEPGVNQQIDAAVRRVLALLDEEYSYVSGSALRDREGGGGVRLRRGGGAGPAG